MEFLNQSKDILLVLLLIILIFVLIKKDQPRIYLSLGLTICSIFLVMIALLFKNENLANGIAYYTMIFLTVNFLLFLKIAFKN